MSAPAEIQKLVERFQLHREEYLAGNYNETQLRREFLDPMFKVLDWDIDNEQGFAEAYKDVVHEDAIRIGDKLKAPDYGFRIGGTRKYFLEAKKPSEHIEDDPEHAFQLRRYGWSAKLPLSILSSFVEFAVYDCRIKPLKTDKASKARVMLLRCEDYLERWDEIASIFSRDAVLKGSFDRFANSTKSKRGTSEVDSEFLNEIESWRLSLARNLALRNTELDQRGLNFAVQRIIDRIVFLRIAEDRGIEDYGQLRKLLTGSKVYQRLADQFHAADDRYNSGLFHFTPEKGRREPPDEFTLSLKVDDETLKEIVSKLYYPDCPYEFSVLPADILGQVYEQFLGKVIRLTTGHQAKVEEKPEVKKAGGVYYTPQFIVGYIVKQTVGRLLDGKTPKQAAKLKVLDPACGSGSFLIGAYQFLLDWHRDWYIYNSPEKSPKEVHATQDGWRLTTAKRKEILLNNIFGVDIDSQAVEVTKLSLLLKVLEGESSETLARQKKLFHERALPDLGDNIKCGNSLIGPDFYDAQQLSLFDADEQYRINAFDWQTEFKPILKSGGFDAVIGNPPYVRIQTMKDWALAEVEFYKREYVSASKGNYDIYVVFVERCLAMLNSTGGLAFILPHKFFNAQYGEPLRSLIADGRHLSHVVHFGDQQIFSNATTYTCLLSLTKSPNGSAQILRVDDLDQWLATGHGTKGTISAKNIGRTAWHFAVGQNAKLVAKLGRIPTTLKTMSHMFVGLQTDADDVFILEEVRRKGDRVLCRSKATEQEYWFEDSHLKPFLKGSINIRRYRLTDVNKRLVFPYEIRDGKPLLIEPDDYQRRFPLTWTYLEANRKRLAQRNKRRMGPEWYGYVYKKNHTRFGLPKLLVPSIATGGCFAADLAGKYFFVGSGGGGGGGYGIVLNDDVRESPYYLLGLLNSRLLDSLIQATSTPFRGGYLALNRQYIEQLPIRRIDFANKSDKSRHDRMVELVERMLALHEQLPKAKTDQEKTVLERQVATVDQQLDQLVYELYGLTDAEITLVEEALSP